MTSSFSLRSSSSILDMLMITALLATAPPKVMSKRLFVAIELPDFVRQHCQELITEQLLPLDQNNDFNVELPTTPSSSVKWVLDESMFHCTLQFLGAVNQAKNSDLTQALSQACRRIPPTTLRLGNIGCFPHRNSAKNARVIWLGLESASNNKGELANISRAIMDATEPLGFQREKRPFSAHVTLGRVRSTKLFSFENGIGWIDMRFLPHITDGEVRLIMDGDECVSVMQRPNRGALCAKAGSPWLSVRISNNVKNPAKAGAKQGGSACSEVEAQRLRMAFLDSLPTLKGILQIENAVLPPLWTADFIRNDLTDGDDAVPWSLCEFNAMSTGYTAFGSADNPRTMQEFGNAMARSIERRFEIHAANKDESKVDVGIN